MLIFVPESRITAEEALNNEIFDSIRGENTDLVADNEIKCVNNFNNAFEAAKYLMNEIKLVN